MPKPALESFMFTSHDYQRYPDGAVDVQVVQKSFDLFYDNGLLAKKLDANAYIRPGISLVAHQDSK
jgi:hypothetical protein